MLSARETLEDKLSGFDTGTDNSPKILPIREARARRWSGFRLRSKRKLDQIRVRSRESVKFSGWSSRFR